MSDTTESCQIEKGDFFFGWRVWSYAVGEKRWLIRDDAVAAFVEIIRNNSRSFIPPSVGDANQKEHRYWAPTLYRSRRRQYHEQRQVVTPHQLEVVPPDEKMLSHSNNSRKGNRNTQIVLFFVSDIRGCFSSVVLALEFAP